MKQYSDIEDFIKREMKESVKDLNNQSDELDRFIQLINDNVLLMDFDKEEM